MGVLSMKTTKNNRLAKKPQSYNLSLKLIEKINKKAEEDNLTNTAVVINALNFYFEQQDMINNLPEILKAYQVLSKQKNIKK